jgi:hypothetical protein
MIDCGHVDLALYEISPYGSVGQCYTAAGSESGYVGSLLLIYTRHSVRLPTTMALNMIESPDCQRGIASYCYKHLSV